MAKNPAPDSTPPTPPGIVPRAYDRLDARGRESLARLSETEVQIRTARAELDSLVARARAAGVPWSAIGWAVGTTGSAARQKWGRDGEP